MSPVTRIVPIMEPSHSSDRDGGDGGITSAIGSPKRVISTGFRVRRTRSKTARHVALNLEIAIVSIHQDYTMVKYHSQSSSPALFVERGSHLGIHLQR